MTPLFLYAGDIPNDDSGAVNNGTVWFIVGVLVILCLLVWLARHLR